MGGACDIEYKQGRATWNNLCYSCQSCADGTPVKVQVKATLLERLQMLSCTME